MAGVGQLRSPLLPVRKTFKSSPIGRFLNSAAPPSRPCLRFTSYGLLSSAALPSRPGHASLLRMQALSARVSASCGGSPMQMTPPSPRPLPFSFSLPLLLLDEC